VSIDLPFLSTGWRTIKVSIAVICFIWFICKKKIFFLKKV
jgi:hypothetical protein